MGGGVTKEAIHESYDQRVILHMDVPSRPGTMLILWGVALAHFLEQRFTLADPMDPVYYVGDGRVPANCDL